MQQIKVKNNLWLLSAWDSWIYFQGVWFFINNGNPFTQYQTEITLSPKKNKIKYRMQNSHRPLLFQSSVLWIVINGNNSIISSFCEMLKLTKGTHILGLMESGSHGTISQLFFLFLVATQKGSLQMILPFIMGRKSQTAFSRNVKWEAIYTAIVHSNRLLVTMMMEVYSQEKPTKNKSNNKKHYYVWNSWIVIWLVKKKNSW